MYRLNPFGSSKSNSPSTSSLTALEEPHQLEHALAAADYIMNDQVDLAEERLQEGESPFHVVRCFFLSSDNRSLSIRATSSLPFARHFEPATYHPHS